MHFWTPRFRPRPGLIQILLKIRVRSFSFRFVKSLLPKTAITKYLKSQLGGILLILRLTAKSLTRLAVKVPKIKAGQVDFAK